MVAVDVGVVVVVVGLFTGFFLGWKKEDKYRPQLLEVGSGVVV